MGSMQESLGKVLWPVVCRSDWTILMAHSDLTNLGLSQAYKQWEGRNSQPSDSALPATTTTALCRQTFRLKSFAVRTPPPPSNHGTFVIPSPPLLSAVGNADLKPEDQVLMHPQIWVSNQLEGLPLPTLTPENLK